VDDTPLRAARRAAGLTQAALAARVDRSPSWVAYVETGVFRLPPRMAERIAGALGIAVARVLPDPGRAPRALPAATAGTRFRCAALHCDLSIAACIARQLRSRNRTPNSDTQRKRGHAAFFPSCTSACAQGRAVRGDWERQIGLIERRPWMSLS
jgi:transcriptional regulator with XRE-family HTH domain